MKSQNKKENKSLTEMSPGYEEERRQYASLLREKWMAMPQKEKALYRKFLLNSDDVDDPAVKLAKHAYQVMREYYPFG